MEMIKESIAEAIEIKRSILNDDTLLAEIRAIGDSMVNALQNGHRILFCGNGGSAADAQHLAAELSGRFGFDRPPLDAEALHCNTSYVTAVANDYGYNEIFSRMVNAAGHAGDVLFCLSTSGNSENIIKAMKAAKNKQMITVAFTGATGGEMASLADHLIKIPSTMTPRIQENHILIGHLICKIIEDKMFGEK